MAKKPEKHTTDTPTNMTPPIRQIDIRALVCCAAAGTLLISVSLSTLISFSLFLGLSFLTYTIFSYIWLRKRFRTKNIYRSLSRIMTADAALIGIIVGILSFSVVPSVLFFTMIQFNSIFNGGIKKWGIDSAAFLTCAGVTALLSHQKITPNNSLEISIVSLIGITLYFCAYALYAHKRIKNLEKRSAQLAKDKFDQKLRSYKLARYLTPTVWRAVSEGREKELTAERKRVTVFFSDIQGFSSLSEELEAETLTEVLNSYLFEMNKIASKHRGTIDKFMGDGVMIIFGDNKSEGVKKDCLRSIAMAVEMRRKMKELQTTWIKLGIKKPLEIRMGINTGYCTVGSFGTNHYMDYTVLGTHVNLASRLESAAEPGEILISYESWSLIKDIVMCRDKGEIRVKGFLNPVKVYQVTDFRKNLGREQSYYEQNLEGFSMHLDLEKMKNYDKDKIVTYLEKLSERIQDKIT